MTVEKISELIEKGELKELAKQCVGIVKSSTLKDDEVLMFISAAILDLERQNIKVEDNIENHMIKGAIIMYVKANFGMVEIKEKELAHKRYIELSNNLSLSSDYKKGADENV